MALVTLALAGACLSQYQWEVRKTPQVGYYVIFADSQFVVVGGFKILTSPDGIAWTTRFSDSTLLLLSIAYGNNQYVAVGRGSNSEKNLLYSPDGHTWTSRFSGIRNLPEGLGFGSRSVAYGNGRYVAVGGDLVVLVSTDGAVWDYYQQDIYSVCFAKDRFFTLFDPPRSSSDGINWTWVTDIATLTSILYANNKFLAFNEMGTILTSIDGTTWDSISNGDVYPFFYAQNLYFAGQGNWLSGGLSTSPDAITWTRRFDYPGRYFAIYSMAYGNNMFVAVGDDTSGGVILTSKAGNNAAAQPLSALTGATLFKATVSGNFLHVAVPAIFWGKSFAVTIYNLKGQGIYYSNVSGMSGTLAIPISRLTPGVYRIAITQSGQRRAASSFVVSR